MTPENHKHYVDVEGLVEAMKSIYAGEGRTPRIKRARPNCMTCWGYGMWPDGSLQPMGPLDAEDGMPTGPCPECGANPNPPRQPHATQTSE